ncbi:stromelysin-1-like [Glandiceps talaboti]
MKSFVLLCLTVLLALCLPTQQAPIDNPFAALEYLQYFGYLGNIDTKAGQLRTAEDLEEAVRMFQRFANLTETGEMDAKTMEMMNVPRCGVPDMVGTSNDARRRKRFAAITAWPKTDLTYRITQYTNDLSRSVIDQTMARALNVWEEHTPLKFTQIYSGTPDLYIFFAPGAHGDGGPFDGPGGVLAHAYFPTNGDAHFDDDELYTDATFDGVNLFQVAAHEFGHSLGLSHSDVNEALMAPFYTGYQPSFQLHSDDIAGIQQLYGMRDVDEPNPNPNFTPPPINPIPGLPDQCEGVFDAITDTADGTTYAFRGQYFWTKLQSDTYLRDAALISNGWPGLPDDLDAAVYWRSNQRTYFFKGDLYWRFSNRVQDAGYPKSVSIWSGLPSNLDAAFVWSGNGKTYFIKGDQYYRYTSGQGVDAGYPRDLSVWNGLPNTIDTAFQYSNGKTYFFSGDKYYRFNDQNFNVDSTYPRPTALWWLPCTDNFEMTTPEPTTESDARCNNQMSIGGSSNVLPSLVVMFFSLLFKVFV